MMKKASSGLSLLFFLAILLPQSVYARNRTSPAPLAFETKSFERRVSGGVDTSFRCDYPVFNASSSGASINLLVIATILGTVPLSEARPVPVSLESAADAFFEEFDSVTQKDKELQWPWHVDIRAHVMLNQPETVTVSVTSSLYTGGAHAIESVYYLVFDPVSGRRLCLNDLFVPAFESRLDMLIEQRFRQMKGLSQNEPLNGERGGLLTGSIVHNDNFALTGTGIVFMYNPYDIAPYAAGRIRVELSYGELHDIMFPSKELKPIE
jgi:hypothetical protein